jgi:hypothetical protein
MHRQVITIGRDGSMSGLQRKPGQGLDLRQFGKADIKRASLIEWDAERQAWFIDVLQEAGRGKLTFSAFRNSQPESWRADRAGDKLTALAPSGWARDHNGDDVLLFAEYDEAVKVEIAYLDALRLKGQF